MRPVGGEVIAGRTGVRRDVRRVADVRAVAVTRRAVGAARKDLKRPAKGVRRGMVGWMDVCGRSNRKGATTTTTMKTAKLDRMTLRQAKRAPNGSARLARGRAQTGTCPVVAAGENDDISVKINTHGR